MLSGLAVRVVESCSARSLLLAAAESCTAGLIASALAEVPGASRAFWGSYVCYTPEAKFAMLGVERSMISSFGAVSAEVAMAMAEGALSRSGADIAVAVTGLAGPLGDGSNVPLGTVWIALSCADGRRSVERFFFLGDRAAVRAASAQAALREVLRIIT